jgi:hypothetical protein
MIKLKKFPFISDIERCYLGANAMTYFERNLIFGIQFPFGDSGAYTGKSGRGVMTFGKLDEKYSDSLNFDYPVSQYDAYDPGSTTYPFGLRTYIGAIHNSNGKLYVSWAIYSSVGDAPISYGIDYLSDTKYNATGELVSLVSYGRNAIDDKAAMSLGVSFDKLKAGEKIQIFLAKNLGDFSDTPEITVDYADTNDRDIYKKIKDIALDVEDFTFLQTKVVLTAGTGQLTSPEVFEVVVGFDDTISLPE